MTRKLNFKLAALCAFLGVLLMAPALAQGKADMKERFKKERAEIIKRLKLSPDQEKALLAVEDKFVQARQQIIDDLKKASSDLKKALAAHAPDEAKVKELVGKLTSAQDKLFESFKKQRDEELSKLTPLEQGKYLTTMEKWYHEMMKPKKGKSKAVKD